MRFEAQCREGQGSEDEKVGTRSYHYGGIHRIGSGCRYGLALPSQRRDGWFLGGGTEYAFNFLPGLFLKSEYRFADFDNHDSNVICTGVLAGCAAGAITSIDRSRVFVQTITTELVYRFNWSGVGAGGGGRY